jgi:copper(I)-binding protein
VSRLIPAFLLSFSLASCGQPAPLAVSQVWTRDTVGGTDNAAVFMTITSPVADRLVSASTPVARRTDLMTKQGGRNAMEKTYLGAMDMPAGKPVSLNPAGWHVWLSDLRQPLRAGQTFPLVLRFERAGQRRVSVSVVAPAAAPPTSGMKM